jgi:hypothetical protein
VAGGGDCVGALVRTRGGEEAAREREGRGTRGGAGDGRRGAAMERMGAAGVWGHM